MSSILAPIHYNIFEKVKKRLFWLLFKSLDTQEFYKLLHKRTLAAMNYGNGDDVATSGEMIAIDYIAKKMGNNPDKYIIFDIGANIGKYTQILCDRFGKLAEIHTFEPSVETFSALKDNIGEKHNVVLNNIGLSDKVCTLPLFSDSKTSGLTSVYDRRLDHFNIQIQPIGEASFDTLDRYCEHANIQHIHFMKMDVEGHEISVLKGAKKMLEENSIDYIQFEFGGCNIDSRTFFQDFWYILHDKYHIYRILQNGLYEITNYSEELEVFICSNFLAEQKSM